MSQAPLRMPLLFIGHGSPMNALEKNPWTETWAALGRALPRPRAVLCLSAHFVTRGLFAVSSMAPRTIHDFYGFPPDLFAVRYPAPGSPELAARAVALLGGQAAPTQEWGLDHGAWSVLRVMYPGADVPVVQLSLDLRLSPEDQLAVGAALRPLRGEGILILGSGNVVHNLREMRMDRREPFPWALAFDEAVQARVLGGDFSGVSGYAAFAGSRMSVPTTEHFVPLLNVLGAADPADSPRAFNHEYYAGSLSMTGYLFTDRAQPDGGTLGDVIPLTP